MAISAVSPSPLPFVPPHPQPTHAIHHLAVAVAVACLPLLAAVAAAIKSTTFGSFSARFNHTEANGSSDHPTHLISSAFYIVGLIIIYYHSLGFS